MKLYIKLFAIATILSLSGCDDYLERYPLNNPSDATFLSNETELNMAITGCYNPLWFSLASRPFPLFFETVADVSWGRESTDMQTIGLGAHDSKTSSFLTAWTYFYYGISRCNYLINNMDRGKDKINADLFNKTKAEARFLRALYYHYLVELFGGVPLVTTTLTLSESQLPRNSKSEIVDFILKELGECANDLPGKNQPTSGRATKGAAWALQSRIALYNQRWDESITAAQKVMALEGTEYVIDPNYMNLFQYAGENSKEIIFSIQFLKGYKMHPLYGCFASRNAKGYSNMVPMYQLADTWECTDGLQIDESPLYDPQNPYKNRDPRLNYTLAVPGSNFLGFQFETNGDSLKCWDYNQIPPKRIANLDATHAYATFTGICWRKYCDKLDIIDRDNSELNVSLIRYAEVLLNYAEAKIESGSIDQSVLTAINKIRQRPSVNMPLINTTNANDLKYIVRRERKYELSGEGLRLFDIRRWGIAEKVMNQPVLGRMKKSYPAIAPVVDEWGTSHYDQIPIAQQGESADFKMRVVEVRTFDKNRDSLWPIPYIEIDTNTKMEQNPGY